MTVAIDENKFHWTEWKELPSGDLRRELYYEQWNSKGLQPMSWGEISLEEAKKTKIENMERIKKVKSERMMKSIINFIEDNFED